jgi:3alpha-hydroxysteroid 3-dehydrogenase
MANHIVITGSASGLGQALAAALVAEGRPVIGIDRHQADIVADLDTPEGRHDAVAVALDASHGRLDGVVSCAALSPLHDDPAAVVGVNYFAALAVLDGLRPALECGDAPAAVAISSIGAVDGTADPALVARLRQEDEPAARREAADGTPYRSAIAYSSAKQAVALAVRARAGSWGRAGVRLNVVAPGRMETPMLDGLRADPLIAAGIEAYPTGIRANGSARDVAGAVRFLLGSEATFVHGQILFVDGGTEALLRPEVV